MAKFCRTLLRNTRNRYRNASIANNSEKLHRCNRPLHNGLTTSESEIVKHFVDIRNRNNRVPYGKRSTLKQKSLVFVRAYSFSNGMAWNELTNFTKYGYQTQRKESKNKKKCASNRTISWNFTGVASKMEKIHASCVAPQSIFLSASSVPESIGDSYLNCIFTKPIILGSCVVRVKLCNSVFTVALSWCLQVLHCTHLQSIVSWTM